MSPRTDESAADGVPVRQVADLILSFGLDLPAAPAPRRGAASATRTAPRPAPHIPAPRAAHDEWAPGFEPVPRPAAHRSDHRSPGHPPRDRSTGRHGLREVSDHHEVPDDNDGAALEEPAVERTVAVSPEILAKARRMAFDPSHPSARTTRTRARSQPVLPAPRPAGDDAWAPGSGAPAPGATTMLRPARREPGPQDADLGQQGPETEWIGEVTSVVPVAGETVHAPHDDDHGDAPATPAASRPPTVLRPGRGRTSRPMFLATASVASVAVVGAAAAAVVGFTGSVTPTAATTSTDLKAALPTAPTTAPTTQPPTAPPAAADPPRGAAAKSSAEGSTPITAVSDEYRDATKKVAGAVPAAMKQDRVRQVVAKAQGLPPGVPAVRGTGRGADAVQAALAEIGIPYKWGGASPSGFDCSGLVVYAFRQLGISLPHSAAALSTMGTAVSKADLQPGDLVFFYTPVSHVAIYIGDGKVVNATSEGEPVQISDLSDFPMHNARRL